MDKNQLRQYMKIVRQTLDTEDLSEKIIKNIRLFPQYKTAKNVLIYYPLEFELNLLPLLDDEDKTFYLPKIFQDNIYICPYKKNDKLVKSEFNTQEPVTDPVHPSVLDLIIVPGICADSLKNRIGYGKGFYDRFLAVNPNTSSIFPLPECCIIKNIPATEHDIKPHFLITENNIIC